MTEQWLPIVGYEGHYEVSDLGRVASLKWGRRRIVNPTPDSGGYLKFHLWLNGNGRTGRVHIHVALAFHGPCPEGLETRHVNGDQLDNRADNLAYRTPAENNQDTVQHGRHAEANKTHCPANHPYDEENTAFKPNGGRRCRACWREHSRNFRAKKSTTPSTTPPTAEEPTA